jgi:hypothetical protein
VVGPLLAAIGVRRVFLSIVLAHANGQLEEALRSEETAEIDRHIADNGIPRLLARRVYRLLWSGSASSRGMSGFGQPSEPFRTPASATCRAGAHPRCRLREPSHADRDRHTGSRLVGSTR